MKKIILISCLLIICISCGSKKRASKRKTYSKTYSYKKKSGTKNKDYARAKRKKHTGSKRVVTKRRKTYNEAAREYILTYKKYAIQEMKVYKIPASITLAQGILESGNGRSDLTQRSNNHFGIKCHKSWGGGRVYHDDDAKGECFRKYRDPAKSFRDHSLFLSGRRRYAKLFTLAPDDYVGWAKGLKKAGYATDRRYPAKLIGIIERFELYRYDAEVLGKKVAVKPKKEVQQLPINTLKIHIVEKGDTLYNISKRYGITVEKLREDNNLTSNTINIGQKLEIDI